MERAPPVPNHLGGQPGEAPQSLNPPHPEDIVNSFPGPAPTFNNCHIVNLSLHLGDRETSPQPSSQTLSSNTTSPRAAWFPGRHEQLAHRPINPVSKFVSPPAPRPLHVTPAHFTWRSRVRVPLTPPPVRHRPPIQPSTFPQRPHPETAGIIGQSRARHAPPATPFLRNRSLDLSTDSDSYDDWPTSCGSPCADAHAGTSKRASSPQPMPRWPLPGRLRSVSPHPFRLPSPMVTPPPYHSRPSHLDEDAQRLIRPLKDGPRANPEANHNHNHTQPQTPLGPSSLLRERPGPSPRPGPGLPGTSSSITGNPHATRHRHCTPAGHADHSEWLYRPFTNWTDADFEAHMNRTDPQSQPPAVPSYPLRKKPFKPWTRPDLEAYINRTDPQVLSSLLGGPLNPSPEPIPVPVPSNTPEQDHHTRASTSTVTGGDDDDNLDAQDQDQKQAASHPYNQAMLDRLRRLEEAAPVQSQPEPQPQPSQPWAGLTAPVPVPNHRMRSWQKFAGSWVDGIRGSRVSGSGYDDAPRVEGNGLRLGPVGSGRPRPVGGYYAGLGPSLEGGGTESDAAARQGRAEVVAVGRRDAAPGMPGSVTSGEEDDWVDIGRAGGSGLLQQPGPRPIGGERERSAAKSAREAELIASCLEPLADKPRAEGSQRKARVEEDQESLDGH